MEKTFLGAAWVMALVTSIVLLAISAIAVVMAATAPASSTLQLDAWRGALLAIVSLVVASTILAALTVARLRRGEELVVPEVVGEEVRPAVVPIEPETDLRPQP
ncbi:hypothetical protein [Agrococcus sp. SGAir0287]|uniref:hypothetical protein n=1 Tax=Agrococcus sp. SGAir0287 TaxID=2070347 RepID=UPI0010CCD564|nr:hypothetical protein [Agrococcus sp. SGAir0287]QCR18813.1 hypothetical protein C1N71_04585 [Agrococcus sp. SGAir0287]